MLKKKLATLMLLSILGVSTVAVGVKGYNNLNTLKDIIKEKETSIKTLEEEKAKLDKEIVVLKGLNTSLSFKLTEVNEEIEANKKQVEELQKVIDEMNKEVTFNSGDVRITSGATEYHLKKALLGTSLHSLAGAFVQAEREYGVNAYFLASIVALESGWGDSPRANNGSNNLTGYAVYSDHSEGTYFSSKEECIMETARLLKEDYLTSGGKYFSDGYSSYHINIKYSADTNWCNKVENITYTLLELSNK